MNDAVQKAFIVLRGNIWQKTEYTINPQMTKTELVPPNKTKSTTNNMHRITGEREAISESCYFKNDIWLTISANNLLKNQLLSF